MSGFLLDTSCVSELVRIKPEPRVTEWIEATDEGLLYLSVLTLGEIREGLARFEKGKRRKQLETWLEFDLQSRFSGRILAIDAPVANRWALLAARAKGGGIHVPIVDGLLAATALHYNLTLVTRNAIAFVNSQVQVLNPWAH